MYRRRRTTTIPQPIEKENLDVVCLQSFAQEKLNTFSEDQPVAVVEHEDEFSGWMSGNILAERINRNPASTRTSAGQRQVKQEVDSSRIFTKRDTRHRRTRHTSNTQSAECTKTGIYILKKEAEYLEGEEALDPTSKLQSKFPQRQDIIKPTNNSHQMQYYPTQNNFFSSKEKYSERQANRKRIKNIRKLSLKYPYLHQHYESLLMTTNQCKALLKKTLNARPNTGSEHLYDETVEMRRHSHRVHSERTDVEQRRAIPEMQNGRPRYIPSSFKKCRMNKRNKSVRLNFVEEAQHHEVGKSPTNEFRGRVKGRPSSRAGPLDDLLKIRFPDFF